MLVVEYTEVEFVRSFRDRCEGHPGFRLCCFDLRDIIAAMAYTTDQVLSRHPDAVLITTITIVLTVARKFCGFDSCRRSGRRIHPLQECVIDCEGKCGVNGIIALGRALRKGSLLSLPSIFVGNVVP